MNALTYSRFGDPSVLQFVDLEVPRPRSGELLIRVHAVSVNPLDGKIRRGELPLLSGRRFPKTPGCDVAGIVQAVGPNVSNFAQGDRVFGFPGDPRRGTLAEYVCVPASSLSKMPEKLDSVGAASIAVVGLAAVQALQAAKVSAGSRVLVNGATGGVGLLLLQLAKLRGAHVTAVVSAQGLAVARAYGADDAIDYRRDSVVASGARFDAVFDLSTKLTFQEARRVLESRGVHVRFEPSPLSIVSSALLNPFRRQRQQVLVTKPSASQLGEIARRVDLGELRLPPSEVFELSQQRAAFARAERGGVIGKVVIRL